MDAVGQAVGAGFLLLGIVMGVAMGWLLALQRANKAVDSRVKAELDEIRDDTITKTKESVEINLRNELEDDVREELKEKLAGSIKEDAERDAKRILSKAEDEAEGLRKKARRDADEVVEKARAKADEEVGKRRGELDRIEEKLNVRETQLDDRASKLDGRANELESREATYEKNAKSLREQEAVLEEQQTKVRSELERVSSYSAEQAKAELVDRMEGEARIEAAKLARKIEEDATNEADKKAKKILSTTIQRWAGEYVTERTVKVVPLPNDDLKGRIIGREGRNIRALEAATGMDIIIDDTPEAVLVSGFDPVRRHVATLTLQKLISDGRIHPSRIEEVVEKTTQEVDQQIKEYGERAAFELGIHGLHMDIIKLLGQLQFRTSYGQNMWSHSIEVGFLCGLMASELGVNVKMARRAGLLHDLGKALTHEQDGSHALIGAEILKRCGEHEIVRNAVAAHHNEEPQNSVIAHLVIAADALSGARPGARREILGTYVKRLEDLERISGDFPGVQKSYAVQAGREIRVMVENSKVNDDEAFALSKEIAKKIEEELTYPGQIKVCVIRETRAVDYAK